MSFLNSNHLFISEETNCGPLSLTRVLGIPKRENTDFMALIRLADVVDVS